jgi:hypothetical protein
MSTAISAPGLPFEATPDAFDEWLAALSNNNSSDYRRGLNVALQSLLGATSCPGQFLHHALEKLRPALFIESHRILQFIAAKPSIPDDKSRKLAWLGVQFAGELGKAYFQLAKKVGAAGSTDETAPIFYIHRAMECLEKYSLHLALIYEHCPSSFWQRVIELYEQAEIQGKTQWKPEDANESSHSPPSIKALMIRILALRLAAPNQLSPAHIQRLHDLLRTYGELVQLSVSPKQVGKTPDFWFDLADPKEPRSFSRAIAEKSPIQARFAYFADFRAKLALLSQHSVNEAERLEEGFVAHLQARLGGMPSFEHSSGCREATVLIEFDEIIKRLTLIDLMPDSQLHEKPAGIALEVLPMDSESAAHDGVFTASKSAGTFQAGSSSTAAKFRTWNPDSRQQACRVTRADAPGYYFLEAANATLEAGALVAVNTDDKIIQLGITGSRETQSSDRHVVFELLANDLVAVNVYLDTESTVVQKAILGSLSNGTQNERGLFAKTLRLRCGDGLTLERNGRKQRVRVTKVRELTSQFGEFEIAAESL